MFRVLGLRATFVVMGMVMMMMQIFSIGVQGRVPLGEQEGRIKFTSDLATAASLNDFGLVTRACLYKRMFSLSPKP